jgi:hypothetical protein
MKAAALGVRFLLELCILASLAAWAAHLPLAFVEKIAVGGVICLAAAGIWGLLLSPRRRFDLSAAARLIIEAVFFVAAAGALVHIGAWGLGIVLLVVAIADRIVLAILR